MTRALGKIVSQGFQKYYRGPDHPMKLRLWDVLWALCGRRRLTVPYANGGWITVDPRDWVQGEIFRRGAYEPEVWEALASRAQENEIFWDIGAHIGSFSIRAGLDERISQVYSFEPDPTRFAQLQANVALNRGRYHPQQFALSDQAQRLSLYQGPTGNTGQTSLAVQHTSHSVEVECRTVDSLIFETKMNAPTLVKIDVEGWEEKVLLGATRLLKECPPKAWVVECACHPDGTPNEPAVENLLRGAGYRFTWIRRPSRDVDARENYLAVRP